MLIRLLQLRTHVEQVCQEQNWDGLLNSDWSFISSIVRLLGPFAKYTQLATISTDPSFSSIVPTVQELIIHVQQVN